MILYAGRLAIVVSVASGNAVLIVLCANKVGDGLRILGRIGRQPIGTHTIVCEIGLQIHR